MLNRAPLYLNTVVTVRKVVHRLELLIYDPNASFVRAVGDLLDVSRSLAQLGQLLVHDLSSLDGRLGVEFGCRNNVVSDISINMQHESEKEKEKKKEPTYRDRRP